jgi:hypothetical protein
MSRRFAPLALLLVSVPALAAERHPPLDAAGAREACESCHASATPEVVKRWEAGRHGLALVKCFVCHGSTGKDFKARGGSARCEGCHPAEAASVVPAKAARKAPAAGCFSCHDPHALAVPAAKANPHRPR